MARNIAAAGVGLRTGNRNRAAAAPLADAGAAVSDTPAEACQGADIVLTALANEQEVADVMDQARDGLGGHTAWVQTRTVSLDGSRRLAEQATRLNVAYVEAPLLGTKEPAATGTLTMLAASPQQEAREEVRPVLEAVGTRTVWLDEVGQPSSLKLAYNAWVLTGQGRRPDHRHRLRRRPAPEPRGRRTRTPPRRGRRQTRPRGRRRDLSHVPQGRILTGPSNRERRGRTDDPCRHRRRTFEYGATS
ncbi:NAD(P)-dependent oxidoreductase [Streptomyces sp. NPDC096311]|uniref:NAD(P)-dependent oxidoreductase n=1 Tax=Streptomyces sp. NPDC096311 TaxID=3366083 RepID=UPI00382C7563